MHTKRGNTIPLEILDLINLYLFFLMSYGHAKSLSQNDYIGMYLMHTVPQWPRYHPIGYSRSSISRYTYVVILFLDTRKLIDPEESLPPQITWACIMMKPKRIAHNVVFHAFCTKY